MKRFMCFLSSLLISAATVVAQDSDTTGITYPETPTQTPAATQTISPVPLKITLFAPSQFDSLLNLIPCGDSIRRNAQVMSIGVEQETEQMVVIFLDHAGNLEKRLVAKNELVTTRAPAITSAPRTGKIEQNGRTLFIIETTLKSLYSYPSAYTTLLDQGNETNVQVIAGLSLLTVGGMLYGSYAFTKDMELGYGKVALMNYGSTVLGNYYPTFLSFFLANATDINELRSYRREVRDSFGNYWFEERPKITDYIHAGTSALCFPLGAYLGSRLNVADKDDYGKVALMTYFSQTFAALSFALPVFIFDDPVDRDSKDYLAASTGLAMAMVPAGFYTGYRIGIGKTISAGRGTLPWVTGAMGALTGLGLASLGDEYYGIASARLILASTMAGYAGGTWLGLTYHPQIAYTFWQSVFIGAAAGAGALIGESLPLMFQANNHRAYILAAIAGGWSGFYLGEKLSLQLFEQSSRDKKTSSHIRLHLPGLSALPLLLVPHKTGSTGLSGIAAMQVADLEWRF